VASRSAAESPTGFRAWADTASRQSPGAARGRIGLVEDAHRMAGRLVLRQVAADAPTCARASQVHWLHRRRQSHGCRQKLAANERTSQAVELSRW